MSMMTKLLLGSGAAVAALASAAPASAQYYPGYGDPYGAVGAYGYGNSQAAVNQCSGAVQAQLSGGYAYNGYANRGARVLGVSRVEPRANGVLVRGVASSGRYGGYGAQAPVDLTWQCRVDFRGFVSGVSIQPAQRNYSYGYQYNSSPYYGDDVVSQYGYHRY